MQHLLAVSDSNRDPLKDVLVHQASWPMADPRCCLMIRVGVRTGEHEETHKKKNTWLCLRLGEEELGHSISDTERNSDDGG